MLEKSLMRFYDGECETFLSDISNIYISTFAGSKPVIRGRILSVSCWNVLPAAETI